MVREKHCSPGSEDDAKTKNANISLEEDSCESRRCTIDPVLLKLRIFFFLFFGGFGTTFPYIGIYFKQIGLSAGSVGLLAGVRPLVQCASGPFWALLADKYKARKAVLLFSILAWLVMTILLAFPRPHHEICKVVNKTTGDGKSKHVSQKKNFIPSISFAGHMTGILPLPSCFPSCSNKHVSRTERSALNDDKSIVISNFIVKDFFNNSRNYNRQFTNSKGNSTSQSKPKPIETELHIERNPKEIRDIFIVLLVLIVVGEFLEAPSFIMTDTVLLDHLGDKKSLYGRTRLFGSLGYGVASFIIGAVLDRFHYQYCGKTMTNYTILFYIFAAFMTIAFIFALVGIDFKYQETEKQVTSSIDVLKLFGTLSHGSFLLIAWFMGFSHGGIMNFLNWYLEDLGATRFMMGIGTSCRATAVIFGFLMSNYFINKLGHYNMILFSLVVYTLSFFGYSVIPNPWYALPIEIGQGICYSMSWSACITYLGAAAPPNAAATVQG